MSRYLCIHGHFYQPPREHAWLESVEMQDSAYPYHDWNQRIAAECYAPNARSRILDGEGRIARLVNNYSRISFNFGPTLLRWLERHDTETYEAILAADQDSRVANGGHGSAMAQVYNHAIMPLCNRRDKQTQTLWGLHDFESRFDRPAEGIWLAETAVDTETLEVLHEQGLRFTLLSPFQAAAWREEEGGEWLDATGGTIDPGRAYTVRLPSGGSIAVFFYDGALSRAVAFERLLGSGARFVERLLEGFEGREPLPARLVHIATDGESYGHHHRHGEMALAWALDRIEGREDVRLINYARFLELAPPSAEVRLIEPSSWSCSHGVGRWREHCGCASEMTRGFTQEWRAPLRRGLDGLRDDLNTRWEPRAEALFAEPWAARNGYIEVVLDRSAACVDRFIQRHARHELNERERIDALRLMELQRQALLMYTSCGWFFEEPSRLETVQLLQYAGRASQLAEELFDDPCDETLLRRLAQGDSNKAEKGSLRDIYHRTLARSRVEAADVALDFAAGLLFDPAPPMLTRAFRIEQEQLRTAAAGRRRFATGRLRVVSKITAEGRAFEFGLVYSGEHELHGGLRPAGDEQSWAEQIEPAETRFREGNVEAAARTVNELFAWRKGSLERLFRDRQRQLIEYMVRTTVDQTEKVYRALHDDHAPLMRLLTDNREEAPRSLRVAAELAIDGALRRALAAEPLEPTRLATLVADAEGGQVTLDGVGLGHAAQETLERLIERVTLDPTDGSAPAQLERAAELIETLPFAVESWRAQNRIFDLLQSSYLERKLAADEGAPDARQWIGEIERLAGLLRVALPN